MANRLGAALPLVLLTLFGLPTLAPAVHLDVPSSSGPGSGQETGVQRPFAAFDTAVRIQGDGFEEVARFTLEGEGRIPDPLTEELSLSVGTFAVTIPAGALARRPAGPDQLARFVFQGSIAGTWLDVSLADVGGGRFELRVEGRGEAAIEIVRPEFVTVRLGDHAGISVSARVDEEG
ncbi:MAG: hypothetical protein ACE147_20725 [Candidatus Methylomirabilales bacterium]